MKQCVKHITLGFVILAVKERMTPQYLTEAMACGRDIHEHDTRGADQDTI